MSSTYTSSFRGQVYALVRRVPSGRVITYGLIARLLGEPGKAREVGWAMAAAPDESGPLPAHRVINSRGQLSGAAAFGGYDVQRARLEAEAVMFLADGRVDLDVYLWLPDDEKKSASKASAPARGVAARHTIKASGGGITSLSLPTTPTGGVEIRGQRLTGFDTVLTPAALDFISRLHREFNPTREALLRARHERQLRFDVGELPDFLPETRSIRDGEWQVAPITTSDLQQRWVELTGPTDRKMLINALNSGADVYMADFEDANSPTWQNMVEGQINLMDAIRGTISFANPDGRTYRLNDKTATLLVRPRGWHLPEKHVLVDDEPIAGALFDFGLYFFHNAQALIDRGSGPYFYLPKLESHREARLWNDVFTFAQQALNIPHGTIKATVLLEIITSAYEMDEILYELRDHSAGLNAGRWDYIFSIIKKFHSRPDFVLPDRVQVTMTVPFMRAYTELLVKTCHRRGAFAMGGMAAFIPSRRDPKVNEVALPKVRDDKLRESRDGFDGTWVAHPDLVPVARDVFAAHMGSRPNQLDRQRPEVTVQASDLLNLHVPDGNITEAGLRANISIGIQYIESWLGGTGAAAIFNLMEDAATAEISRSQVWQWIHHGALLDDGRRITHTLVLDLEADELTKIRGRADSPRLEEARLLFDAVALSDQFVEFLTLPAYGHID